MSPARRYPSYLCIDGQVATLAGRALSLSEERRLRRFHRGEAARLGGEAQTFHLRCWAELLLVRRLAARSCGRREWR